jgi:hypothetical protein
MLARALASLSRSPFAEIKPVRLSADTPITRRPGTVIAQLT